MDALVFHGPHRLAIERLPEPAPVEGEVKLRVRACGICGSDVHGYTGESGRRVAGQVMGHEFSGEIAALGPGVTGYGLGERVAAYNLIGCGRCPFCRAGREQICPDRQVIGVNTGTRGAFAEYVCVPAANLVRLSPGLDYAAALLNEPLAVATHALGHVPADAQTVAIVGGGTIGLCLAAAARAIGGRQVFLLEPIAEKRAIARRFGAEPLEPDRDALRARTGGLGADAAVEAVGQNETANLALEVVRPGGTVVLVGNLAREVHLPLQTIVSTEKRLEGSYGFSFADFRQVMEWLNTGTVDLSPLLSGTCTLDEAPSVFADLAAGRRQAIKLAVCP